jgi:hypothetical protein
LASDAFCCGRRWKSSLAAVAVVAVEAVVVAEEAPAAAGVATSVEVVGDPLVVEEG